MPKREPTPIERAIDICRTQAGLARRINKTQQTVSFWKKRGVIPAEDVPAVEAATGIPRNELRPDIFGKAGAAA